jgi:CheY-like chemotaxis protein
MTANEPPNQANRVAALRRYKILDTPRESLYDDIAFLPAQICESPTAAINLIDERRQWFKAEIGLRVRQTPQDTSICSHAILESESLLVPDTLLDFLPVAPRVQEKSIAAAAPSPYTMNQRGCGTILLGDDEESVRQVAQAALQRLGYEVLLAKDGKHAVELFKDHRGKIRLIVLDLTMPVMNGEEASVLLRDADPVIPILLSSGYNQVEIIERFAKQNITGFIQKPYTVTQLKEAIANVLQDSAPGSSTQS